MPRLAVAALGHLAAGILLAAVCLPVAQAKEAVTWIQSYHEALDEARRTGKPIFHEFRCAP